MADATHLRKLSARPELLVGLTPPIADPTNATQVGIAGPVGRERVLFALPLGGYMGPQQIAPMRVIHGGDYLADPQGNFVGDRDWVWISRLLTATRAENTRR
jgi:hypothetical protein